MRIALISDLHGNLISLDAVLSDLSQMGVDQIVCLGDVATLGPHPQGVVERLRELAVSCVMGNHETYVLDPATLPHGSDMPRWMQEQIRWAAEVLPLDSLDFLRSFKDALQIPLGQSRTLHCVHGSPRSNEEMMLSTTPRADVDAMLDGLNADVLAHGHSHVQMARRHGATLLVNPGSVGEPLARMPFVEPRFLPWAEYALLHIADDRLGVDLRRVPIDTESLIRAFEDCAMPNAGFWVDMWRLSTS